MIEPRGRDEELSQARMNVCEETPIPYEDLNTENHPMPIHQPNSIDHSFHEYPGNGEYNINPSFNEEFALIENSHWHNSNSQQPVFPNDEDPALTQWPIQWPTGLI